ncbi:hypothetical protein [Blastomonas fulva]|uniref:hypothetical protein n=1 Tax=Blastomonas fulva TaxID=1550728 RepID=UPI0040349E5F
MLNVQQVVGRGGQAGKQYRVDLTTLPTSVQIAFHGAEAPLEALLRGPSTPSQLPVPIEPVRYAVPALSDRDKTCAQMRERLAMIQDALAHPPRSPERTAELERAAAKHKVAVRTLQRWIRNVEECGGDVGALANQRPRNSGQRRVIVSRDFDQAWRAKGYPEDVLASLDEWVSEEIESWWQSPAQRAGWRRVQLEVQTGLVLECQGRGFPIHKRFCELSKRRIMTASHHRIVDIRDNDRKRYDDAKPRIRRDNTKFAPMQQIVMDVKPIDNIVLRPDGSEAWPKMIAFQDTGTHRIFCWFVLLPPGEGVRQEHVIEAFLAMVSHPEWGFPKQLYRDNGTEFAVFDKIRSAITMIGGDASRSIINAKPYSGASKPIESKFSMLDRSVFSQMGGYAGGNRMNKKTQTVGKPPAPYQGSFDQFVQEALARILDVHHNMPLHSGPFKGQTSADAFARHASAGWRPVMVDPLALDASFCTMDSRKVDRGFVSIDGNRYSHPELPNGRSVTIARPWRRGALPLVELPELGWAALRPDMLHLPGDIAGAIEASRMQAKQDREVTTMKRKARKANPARHIAARLATLPTNAAPAPLMDVMLSSLAEDIAKGMKDGDAALKAIPDAKARERARMMAETEELERYLAQQYG